MLNILQTIGVMAAVAVSVYTVWRSERNRRRDDRRRRVERVLEATLALTEAAIRMEEMQGEGPRFAIAKQRLKPELTIAGVDDFKHTDLMVRRTATAAMVRDQSEAAIPEIRQRLDEI